jgi:hypothetical protein
MQSDLNLYIENIESLFSTIVKKYNKLQLSDHTNNTIIETNDIIKRSTHVLKSMKQHVVSLESLLSDCVDFVKEVEEDLSCPPKDDYVYHTSGGMLSYPGRELLLDILKKPKDVEKDKLCSIDEIKDIKDIKEKDKEVKIERSLIPELGYYLKLPIVNDLKSIPISMYYYKGDNANIPGIYMNILNNNIVRIPFPEILDSKREYDRTHSIRCKYSKKEECDANRTKMAKYHNSSIRTCNFAHSGDKIIKIGYPSRCPSVPDFGNPQTMASDIKKVNMTDVKNMLMYGLSDIVSSVIWFDYNSIINTTLSTLEKA